MKKIALILTVVLSTLLINQVNAQGFKLGLSASPSMAWFKSETENYESEGLRFGFSYGLLSEFILAEQYTFATGINISYFGGRLTFPYGNDQENGPAVASKERTYRLQNLEVPFTLKMKTREIGYNTYFARFGFGGSVNLRAKGDDKFLADGGNQTHSLMDIDIKDDIPLFRISMIVGIGFEHSLGGTTALVAGVNFNNGFTNILKGKDWKEERNQQARANFLELSLGIIF